ncbi:MAG: PHP domain-containing protein [Candidatus Jordarchaeum sp.]|uniref:PHP domain-containing protein n=1 Tax=Candidatus Jordarchaeum sp. TaxID=2823881 RepID=UPI00404A6F62
MKLVTVDYHIHSTWSDGYSSIEGILNYCIRKGLQSIGITDHYSHNTVKCSQITENLSEYFSELQSLSDAYRNKILLRKGIEIDTRACVFDSPEECRILTSKKFDYYLFEYVTDNFGAGANFLPYKNNRMPLILLNRIRDFKKLLPKECSVGLAHAYLHILPEEELEEAIELIIDADIFVELNSTYQNYKMDGFEKIFETEEIKLSLGSDAHTLHQIGKLEQPLKYVKGYHAEDRLVFMDGIDALEVEIKRI